MRSLIKTALIAAFGVAVISASPAFAAKGTYNGDTRGAWQAQLEYLKDAPAHNGNNY